MATVLGALGGAGLGAALGAHEQQQPPPPVLQGPPPTPHHHYLQDAALGIGAVAIGAEGLHLYEQHQQHQQQQQQQQQMPGQPPPQPEIPPPAPIDLSLQPPPPPPAEVFQIPIAPLPLTAADVVDNAPIAPNAPIQNVGQLPMMTIQNPDGQPPPPQGPGPFGPQGPVQINTLLFEPVVIERSPGSRQITTSPRQSTASSRPPTRRLGSPVVAGALIPVAGGGRRPADLTKVFPFGPSDAPMVVSTHDDLFPQNPPG
jgi:hypothetical protein